MGFITMMLGRVGYEGNSVPFFLSEDEMYFGIMVVYGYFFFTLIQVAGIAFGDKNAATVILRIFWKSGTFKFVQALRRTVVRWGNKKFNLLQLFQPISTSAVLWLVEISLD